MRYLLSIALLLLAGCSNEIYLRDGVTDGDTFFLAPVAAVDSDPVLQSWVAYSLAKSVCQLELGGENPSRANSFDCEFKSRRVLVDTWAEKSTESAGLSDDYLDRLLAVRDAGYLGAYTAYFFRRDDWSVPAEIDVDGFDRWRRQNLRRHRPETRLIGYWGYINTPSHH